MSLLTYVKENPIQSALTVASVIPIVRGASLLYKGYKRAAKLGQILTDRKSITLYRGVPLGKVSLKDAKQQVRYSEGYGKWFTTDKQKAQIYARQQKYTAEQQFGSSAGKQFVGKLYSTKVSPVQLRKIKQSSKLYGSERRDLNRRWSVLDETSIKLTDKTFFGTVPKEIRRTAKLVEGIK